MTRLTEKPTGTKLALLYEKHLYSLALSFAHTQNLDTTDVHRHHGDHLCEKGDYEGAMKEYLQTIGSVRGSYVVRRVRSSSSLLYISHHPHACTYLYTVSYGQPDSALDASTYKNYTRTGLRMQSIRPCFSTPTPKWAMLQKLTQLFVVRGGLLGLSRSMARQPLGKARVGNRNLSRQGDSCMSSSRVL